MAPKRFVRLSLTGAGSTTTTREAPAIDAPMTALVPMPPAPTTTTVSPGATSAIFVADPYPVGTPQESRETYSSGTSSRIFTACDSWTVTYGEKVPSSAIGAAPWPLTVVRNVSSASAMPPMILAP